LDDNKLLAQLFKTHQGYQELLIPTDEVPTDGVQTDGNNDTVIAPIYKAGDTLTCGGVYFTIDRVDYAQQKYFDDSIGGFIHFSDQNKWAIGVRPKFEVGDEVYNRLDKSLGHVVIESVDDTTYYGDTTNFDIADQDQWELVKKPLTVHEAIKHAKEVARTCDDPICAKDHKNLAYWLEELMEYRHRYGPFIETCDD
jgi:hypothetical protein